jgi:AcrR family transcriptional regulator
MATAKGETTRKRIFDAAARLFAVRGYGRTSIRDLAQALGLQKSSLYHHFESKEDLLYQLVGEFMDEALVYIEDLGRQAIAPLEKLSAFLKYYTEFYAAEPYRLTILVNELDCLDPQRRKEVVAKERRYVRAIKAVLDELQEAGLMRDIPPAVAVFAFFGMVHYTPKWYRTKGQVRPEELGRLFEAIFCSGVLAAGATQAAPKEAPANKG